jgi:predicted RNA-binding Zn-ribbon protein involved in translation (DUF1610 family)
MISVAIEVQTTCGTCQMPMPVNTLAPEVSCPSCGRPTAIRDDVWRSILRDPTYDGPRMIPKDTRQASGGKLSLSYKRLGPCCQGCKQEIPVASILEVNDQAMLRCDRCAAQTWVRSVPASLAGALPNITHLVGEDPDPRAGEPASPAEAATFPCPQCGSPVPFDGVTRALTCRFCSASVHVPDDFIYRGKRRIVAPWFLCFHPSVTDDAPAPQAIAAGLFDWEGVAQGVIDAEGNLYCACIQVHWFLDRISRVEQKREFVLWSADPALNVRWVRRDLHYEMGDELRLVFSPPGEILITDCRHPSQRRLSCADGSTVAEVSGSKPEVVRGPSLYEDLTCDRDGSVLMLKEYGLLRFDPNGKERPVWSGGASGDESDDLPEARDYPVKLDTCAMRIHVGFDGSLYFYNFALSRYENDGRKSYCIELPFHVSYKYRTIGGDSRGFVYLLGSDTVLRYSPSGACEVILERQRDGLPRDAMNIAVAPDGSFWLFSTEGLAWKLASDSALLFASGSERRPEKPTREELQRQKQEASARKEKAREAALMVKAEAMQKEIADNIAQTIKKSREEEAREGRHNVIIMLLVFLAMAVTALVIGIKYL